MHVVADARELLRAGEAGGAGADDGDLLAGLLRGDLGRQPAVQPGAVDDGAFDRLDRHRLVAEVQRAGGLARRGADAAGELREVVGRVEVARGLLPVGMIDEVVPVGDLVVHRATDMAVGDAAVHAARGLIPGRLLRQRDDEFAVMANAVGGRRVAPVAPVDLQESSHLAHKSPLTAVCWRRAPDRPARAVCFYAAAPGYMPTAASAPRRSSFISSMARRYSIGMTLRNLPRYSHHLSRICFARFDPVKSA